MMEMEVLHGFEDGFEDGVVRRWKMGWERSRVLVLRFAGKDLMG